MSHPSTHSSISSNHSSTPKNYHLSSGKKFSGGYYYSGRNHSHWSYCYYDRRYSCYLYWDPCVSGYYYWCAPQTCYYPVSYCPSNTYCYDQPTVTPAPVASVPTVNANAVATVNVNAGVAPAPLVVASFRRSSAASGTRHAAAPSVSKVRRGCSEV